MAWGSVASWFGFSDPKWPDGQPVKLPSYFPVQPKGCESVSLKLFECVTGPATEKLRDMERAGYHKSYFSDVPTTALEPKDEKYAKYVNEQQDKPDDERDKTVPKRGDNPLDVCQNNILLYQKCCDRALQKKQNWILTEPYRVQEEYRYAPAAATASAQKR